MTEAVSQAATGPFTPEYKELTQEQQDAIKQFVWLDEAPDIPWPMSKKIYVSNYSIPNEFIDWFQKIDEQPMDSIQALAQQLSTRYAFTSRIYPIVKDLSISKYVNDEKALSQCTWRKLEMEKELDKYEYFQKAANQANMQAFFAFYVEKNAEGNLVAGEKARAIIPYGGYVGKHAGKWMFMEDARSDKTTFVQPQGVKVCEDYIQRMVKVEAVLTNPLAEKQSAACIKAHYIQDIIREAIANNSKDNITYISMPAPSALDSELKAQAMKVVRQYNAGNKVLDVRITSDWYSKPPIITTSPVLRRFTDGRKT